MPERTHLPIQDEALRQARRDTIVRTATTTLAHGIADYLTETRPADHMIEASRQYLAGSFAKGHAHHDHSFTAELTASLLALLPKPGFRETRGDYAQRIRPTTPEEHA